LHANGNLELNSSKSEFVVVGKGTDTININNGPLVTIRLEKPININSLVFNFQEKRHVISENRKMKTEPVTGRIFVPLGKLVRTVPISTLQIFCH
jgi:hypothetical protein